jgi:hypothetical protein
MDTYTGAENPYDENPHERWDDGTNAPHLDWFTRRWTGLTGGNRGSQRVCITYDPGPLSGQTVTLEEYNAGLRP